VAARTLSGSTATCVFALPRAARGKRLAGRITVTAGGATATRAFSAVVHG
jgi:hypothetical protein